MIEIAFFDMDHTVLDTDCDLSWKYFLVDEGLAPPTDCAEADRFFELYHQGRTPVDEFVQFQLREFVGRSSQDMRLLADRHFEKNVRQYIYPQARQEINQFNQREIITILLTGTNRIIAEPIAKALNVSKLIATEPEINNGHFTGKIVGPFLMKKAKMQSALDFCLTKQIELNRVAFYADSVTDIAMLEQVSHPVVVNPRQKLLAIAKQYRWRIEHWSPEDKHSPFSRFSQEA